VIAFDFEWRHTDAELAQALNAHLPGDAAVRSVRRTTTAFHPRYDARRRSYQYHVFVDPLPDPLRERYGWRLDQWPSLELLQAAGHKLTGYLDCAAFGSPPRKGGATHRKIYRAEWLQTGQNSLEFHITANAFLYHMARRIVYLGIQVGTGRLDTAAFNAGVRLAGKLPGGLAPANGLVLTEVDYESPWDPDIPIRAKNDGIVEQEKSRNFEE
jgi:tRNA pseudouridine38-40 synthase